MPPREIRLLFWDEKLRTKGRFTLRQLLESFSRTFDTDISIRTFREDMKVLRDRNAPLCIERFDIKNAYLLADEKSYYFYTSDFTLSIKQPLNAEDAERMRQALIILKQFKNLPQFRDLEAILFKLEHEAGIKRLTNNDKKDIIKFEQVEQLRGVARLELLYNAILNEQALQLHYMEFEQPSIFTPMHPYFLKEFNNRWYVFGLDQNENIIRPFALDRISRISPSSLPFIRNTSIDFNSYFNDKIGISALGNPPVETIVVRIAQPRAQYVITKPWHDSQTIIEESPITVSQQEPYVIFQFRLILNRELEAKILEFGCDIEVIQPLHYRKHIASILQKALMRY